MTTHVCSGAALAEEIKKRYGDDVRTVTIEMKYEKEVSEFLRKIDEAHKRTAESNLVFK